ncbi:hypothetical protein ACH470_03200 [Streptomyces bottropensis]|uniref:hypothetical protein n=1 Tax=Streptomyces bottropensis TaxID=42235 RepID=UPI0037B8FEFE
MPDGADAQVPVCAHWIGAEQRHCHSTDHVRSYLTGLCCPLHTPNALRGLPEAPPGPGIRSDAPLSPLSTSRVHDARAVASGKRRSSPATYRAAQAATRKARP